ncbi:histidine phosphatase family protein [Enterococcus casseliflavus]|uniref:histidine phosphatase family protein n=1 Tax=Enterococcus casseliflavus TaxID=37734 RepID=UPI0039A6436E
MKIFLVRHGETYLNKYGRMQGWADTPLTDKGKENAKLCGQYLATKGITHLVTSDLGRTIETSKIVKSYLNLNQEMILMPEFRETFFGSFEGELNQYVWPTIAKNTGFDSVEDFYMQLNIDEVMDAFHESDPAKDAEDYQTFIQRIILGLEKLSEMFNADDKVVLVTHGNTIRNIAYLIDKSINCGEELVNLGITTIALNGPEKQLISYNVAAV